MSGIEHEIFLDRRHIAKHLPDTMQSNRLLRRGRSVHVFNDEAILLRVAAAIIEQGIARYGLLFLEVIGVRISPDGSTIPLFYAEVKIDADNRYHPVPRSRPSEK